MANIKITKTEWEVMRVLWTQSSAYSSEIIAILSEKLDFKPTTVKTLIARLVKKGYVGQKAEGNRYCYFPTISEKESLKKTRAELTHNICSTKMGAYIAALIAENPLSHDDITLITQATEQKSHVALEKVPCDCVKGQCHCADPHCSQK